MLWERNVQIFFLDRFHVIEKPVICGQLEFS